MRYSVTLYWDDETQAWTAEVPVLDGVATCGGTVEEALAMARELIALTVAGMREDGDPVPQESVPTQLHTLDITEAEITSILASATQTSSAQLD